jgi:hypothetical protein
MHLMGWVALSVKWDVSQALQVFSIKIYTNMTQTGVMQERPGGCLRRDALLLNILLASSMYCNDLRTSNCSPSTYKKTAIIR